MSPCTCGNRIQVSREPRDHIIASLPIRRRSKRTSYAPLYCATSSPRMKVCWLLSNSSAKASFRASRTATSLVPLSDAYPRARKIDGAQDLVKAGRIGVNARREESNRDAGRKSRGAAMAAVEDGNRGGRERKRDYWQVRKIGRTSQAIEDQKGKVGMEERSPMNLEMEIRRCWALTQLLTGSSFRKRTEAPQIYCGTFNLDPLCFYFRSRIYTPRRLLG